MIIIVLDKELEKREENSDQKFIYSKIKNLSINDFPWK